MLRRRVISLACMGFVVLGTLISPLPANAASGTGDTVTMKFHPKKKHVGMGTTFGLGIRVDTAGLNAGQAQFYVDLPPGLQCVKVITATDVWDTEVARRCETTRVGLSVANSGPVNGKVLIGRIKLKAVETGTSRLEFKQAGTFVFSWDTRADILERTKTGTVRVTSIGATADTTITTGNYHTCALATDAQVRCWGENYHGQLGDGTTTDRLTPVRVTGL